MFMNGNRATSQGTAKAGFLDLPHSFANAHRVVFGHDSFRLHAEDPVQVRPAGTAEGTPLLFGCNGELDTDLVEPLSLDEAYLDVTENKTGLPTARRVARTIREQIHQE